MVRGSTFTEQQTRLQPRPSKKPTAPNVTMRHLVIAPRITYARKTGSLLTERPVRNPSEQANRRGREPRTRLAFLVRDSDCNQTRLEPPGRLPVGHSRGKNRPRDEESSFSSRNLCRSISNQIEIRELKRNAFSRRYRGKNRAVLDLSRSGRLIMQKRLMRSRNCVLAINNADFAKRARSTCGNHVVTRVRLTR